CSRNWASPCISYLLARGLWPLSAGRLGKGAEGFRKQGDGLYVVLGSSQLLQCGRYLIGMAGGVKPSATRTRARSSLFQSRSGLRFWFDVGYYVGNLSELDLGVGGDPARQGVGLDHAGLGRDFQVQIQFHGAAHATRPD